MIDRINRVSQELLLPGVIEERLMTDPPTRISRHRTVENPFSIEQDIDSAVMHFGLASSVELIRNRINLCATQKAKTGIGIGLLSIVGNDDLTDSKIHNLLVRTSTGLIGKFGKTERMIKEAANIDSESYLKYERYTPLAQALDTRYVLDNNEVRGRFALTGLQKSLITINHIRRRITETS